jgi:hypothetical protein
LHDSSAEYEIVWVCPEAVGIVTVQLSKQRRSEGGPGLGGSDGGVAGGGGNGSGELGAGDVLWRARDE